MADERLRKALEAFKKSQRSKNQTKSLTKDEIKRLREMIALLEGGEHYVEPAEMPQPYKPTVPPAPMPEPQGLPEFAGDPGFYRDPRTMLGQGSTKLLLEKRYAP